MTGFGRNRTGLSGPHPNPSFDASHGPIADLKGQSVRSGAVTLGSQAVLLLINTVSLVIMARLLSPKDYGVITMVTAVTGFANLFNDLGLSSATVQKAEINHRQVSALFWINVLVGLLLMLVVAALAPAVAWFYNRPELVAVTLALSVTFPLTGLGAQHRALLRRAMHFGRLAAVNIAALSAGVLAGIVTALAGGRYWSLVVTSLVIAFCGTLGVWLAGGVRFRPAWRLKGSGIGELIRFGSHITAFDVVNYFHRNLDNILIGRVWGAQQLGLYSRAYGLLMLPITNLREPLNAVAFPALSRLQADPNGFRAYYTRYCSILAFVTMPVVAFLFIASAQLVGLLLGKQWLDAGAIFSILALAAFIQPVAGLRGLVLLAGGRGSRYFGWGLINATAAVVSFLCGIPWGAKGVAAAYCIMTYLILHPSLIYVFKDSAIRPGDFYRAVARPFAASVVMAGAGSALMARLEASWPAYAALSLCALACLAVYLGAYYLLPGGRKGLGDTWSYLLLLRSRATPAG